MTPFKNSTPRGGGYPPSDPNPKAKVMKKKWGPRGPNEPRCMGPKNYGVQGPGAQGNIGEYWWGLRGEFLLSRVRGPNKSSFLLLK